MDSKTYEKLVTLISGKLTNNSKLIDSGQRKFGKDNLWEGASGFRHQIDVSIHDDTDILLIECKSWTNKVRAIEYLTLMGRLIDIKGNPACANHNVRGAIVTTVGWQRGVEKLVKHYSQSCSVFIVGKDGQIKEMIHTHYVNFASVL